MTGAGAVATVEAVMERLLAIEAKLDEVRSSQSRAEAAVVELSRDVAVLRERMFEEAGARRGLGRAVGEHDVDLAVLKGGRSS